MRELSHSLSRRKRSAPPARQRFPRCPSSPPPRRATGVPQLDTTVAPVGTAWAGRDSVGQCCSRESGCHPAPEGTAHRWRACPATVKSLVANHVSRCSAAPIARVAQTLSNPSPVRAARAARLAITYCRRRCRAATRESQIDAGRQLPQVAEGLNRYRGKRLRARWRRGGEQLVCRPRASRRECLVRLARRRGSNASVEPHRAPVFIEAIATRLALRCCRGGSGSANRHGMRPA